MLTEVRQVLWRLQALGLSSSRAACDLQQLHDRYAGTLTRIADCAPHPHVMRILAEEAVEGLTYRFQYLGIPFSEKEGRTVAPYWLNYIRAVRSGELMDTEYSRFQQAQKLMEPFFVDSYVDDKGICSGEYKAIRYAYAMSNAPMPVWFSPESVMQKLEEIVTAFGFLWFSVVDFAEEQYYAKGA